MPAWLLKLNEHIPVRFIPHLPPFAHKGALLEGDKPHAVFRLYWPISLHRAVSP